MSLILSKRDFIKGLIAVPAIVSINNIMPVKAIERFTSIPSYDRWCLVRDLNTICWMKESDVKNYQRTVDVLLERKLNYPIVPKERTQFTVDLMKIKSAPVIHELPLVMQKSNIFITNEYGLKEQLI